jgi:hypothetical protein
MGWQGKSESSKDAEKLTRNQGKLREAEEEYINKRLPSCFHLRVQGNACWGSFPSVAIRIPPPTRVLGPPC